MRSRCETERAAERVNRRVFPHISLNRLNPLAFLSSLRPPHSNPPTSEMANEATPRINAAYLEQFVNRTVRMVGKVQALRGETATLDSNGPVTVHLNRVSCA